MRSEILGILGKRFATAVAAFATGAALVGGSYAAIGHVGKAGGSHPTPEVEATATVEASESPEPTPSATEGVHGGTVERQHDGCSLTDVTKLTGNWTHGDYVAAVAADGGNVAEAAKSDCGKPMTAVHPGSTETPAPSSETHGKSGETHGKSAEHRPTATPTPETIPPTPETVPPTGS